MGRVPTRSTFGNQLPGIAQALVEAEIRFIHEVQGVTEQWHNVGATGEPAFQGGWFAERTVSFRRDPEGVVHLRGMARFDTAPAGLQTIFNLPAGYRPLGSLMFPLGPNGVVDGGIKNGSIEIDVAGAVNAFSPNKLVSFDKVRLWRAAIV